MIFSKDEKADRAFFRDVLRFPFVDSGGGWLIFRMPPTELGIHPADPSEAHELYLMCDDIRSTLAMLQARDIVILQEPTERGWGTEIIIMLPGGSRLAIYQPRHASPLHR